jgi:hypothetical protein
LYAIPTSESKAGSAPGQSIDRDRISLGFINIRGASINESEPGINHPGVGIYLHPSVEIAPAVAGEGALGNG